MITDQPLNSILKMTEFQNETFFEEPSYTVQMQRGCLPCDIASQRESLDSKIVSRGVSMDKIFSGQNDQGSITFSKMVF